MAATGTHRLCALVPCGGHRACLLEVTGGDAETAEVVAATEGKSSERWSAPGADHLVPFGERVLADRPGVAVRVDAGTLLVFADPLTSSEDDRSVAGVGAESGKVVELGLLTDVRGESCSWNTSVIACGRAKEFELHRFAPAD